MESIGMADAASVLLRLTLRLRSSGWAGLASNSGHPSQNI
jgi:hypothetical protein